MAMRDAKLRQLEQEIIPLRIQHALAQACHAPKAEFANTLWQALPAGPEVGTKWMDMDLLSDEELALLAGPGFAIYASCLEPHELAAIVQGREAMEALGMESYEVWHKRQL